MPAWTATEVGMFVSLLGATLVSLIFTITKSRCTNIKMCGCIECQRKVEETDLESQSTISNEIESQNVPIPITEITESMTNVQSPHRVRDAIKTWNNR